METYIIKPKNKKDAEIAEAVMKKMRIPIEKVSSINEEEELIPMEDFFKDLNKRLKKHYTKKWMQVLFSKKAYKSILSLEKFLTEEIQMPLTAYRYSNKMEIFAKSLAKNPIGYKICSRPKWNLNNYRCATFDKKWIFVFEVLQDKIIIRELVLGKLLK